MLEFDSSDSDEELAEPSQVPTQQTSSDHSLQPISQPVRQNYSLPDEPSLFSLSLNVEPLVVDEKKLIDGDTVHFFTGNPSIQKFKGHVRACPNFLFVSVQRT